MASGKRLIDANALQLEPDLWGGMNGVICLGRSGGKTMATVQAALKSMIDNAPTVDAVEVVRCKDCKHYNLYRLECHNGWMNGWVGIDGFCSYGERRTDVRVTD